MRQQRFRGLSVFTPLFAFLLAFLLGLSGVQKPLSAVMADQNLMRKILPQNKLYLEFANIAITNFGSEEDFDLFVKAVSHDFYANIYTLQGEYVKSHSEIMLSQKLISDLLFKLIITKYEPDTDALLRLSAPIIFHAKDKKAEYFLNAGYRYMGKANEYKLRGKNSNRFLYSVKINYYMQAILELRAAKKYAILALTESKIPMIDKKEYVTQTYNEALGLSKPQKIDPYKEVEYEIKNSLARNQLPENFPYLLHHADNHGIIFDFATKDSALIQANKQISGSMESGMESDSGDDGAATGNGNGNGANSNNPDN